MPHLDEGTLQAWLDRPRSGLNPEEALEIERHLEECDQCAAALEELGGFDARAVEILAGAERSEVEIPDFEVLVEAATGASRERPSRSSESRLRTLAWAASLILALGIGWVTNDVYRGASDGRSVGSADVALAPEAAPGAREEEEELEAQATGPVAQGPVEAATSPPAAPPGPLEARVQALQAEPGDAVPPAPQPSAAAARAADLDLADRQDAVAEEVIANDVTGTIRGRVTDAASGQPVVSAQVFVPGADVRVLTQRDGSFDIRGVQIPPDSMVDVVVQRLGFRERVQEVALGPGRTTVADFSIDQAALQLDEVVVTGTPGDVQRLAIGNSVERTSPDVEADAVAAGAETDAPQVRFVSGLEVVEVEILSTGEAVRVVQALDPSTRLVMVQSVGVESNDLGEVPEGQPIETIELDGLFVTGTAPVPVDSLRTLLGSLEP